MTDNELLMAISEIVDKKINAAVQPIKNDMNATYGNINQDIRAINDEMRATKVEMRAIKVEMRAIKVDLLENNVLPRLSSMEEHYVATANRYINSTEAIESIQSDVDTLKKVVREHSEKLQKIS